MADEFTNHIFRTAVASLCQAIGWNSAQTTTIDILSDLWRRQVLQIAKVSTNYAVEFGRTNPTLDHTALAFDQLNLSVREVEEYVSNFDPVQLPYSVPVFPIPKESNLNLLRPGSEEVLTRPVHVHEYLPTWNPVTREDIKRTKEVAAKSISENESEVSKPKTIDSIVKMKIESSVNSSVSPTKSTPTKGDSDSEGRTSQDKVVSAKEGKGDEAIEAIAERGTTESPSSSPPQTPVLASKPGKRLESPFENPALKRVRMMLEEEGYAVRQISSAMMTTSGYLTSSVEGRLPDTRPPPNMDFFEPAPAEKKKKIPTMKRIIEGIKKIDKEKENQSIKADEEVEEYQDNLFSNPDRIQKLAKPTKETEEKLKAIRKATRAFKSLEKSYKEQQRSTKRKESKGEKRKRKGKEESESEVESVEEAYSDLDKTPEEVKVEVHKEIQESPKKNKRPKIPKITLEKVKEKKERKQTKQPKIKEETVAYDIEEVSPAPTVTKRAKGKKTTEFSDMPTTLFTNQFMPADDDYTKVRRRSKRNSIDQSEMDMLMPEISINVSKQSRPPQPPPDFNLTLGRIPMQPGLIPATFNTQSLLQQQNQFSIVPSISITPSTPDISLTPLTPRDLATPSSSLGLTSNIGSSITITRISMSDKSMQQQSQAQTSSSSLNTPLSISITKESPKTAKTASPNVSYQKESKAGITITPIMMKHSIPDFSLTEGEMARERQKSGSAKLEEDFKTKEQRKKDREKRKELKKERKKEKKLKEKEKGKVEKIKLSSDGTGSGFSVERKEKKDKDKKKKSKDSLPSTPARIEATVPKLTLKLHSNASTPVDSPRGVDRETPPPVRKITIKSVEESIKRRTPSPELARFSPLITGPPKLGKIPKLPATPKPAPQAQPQEVVSFPPPGTSTSSAKKNKKTPRGKGKASQSGLVTETVGFYVDEAGNKIWICPACGRQDDGTPMIGCDTCDDWYHFTCVGITEEPDETESWFCTRHAKKNRPSDQKSKVLKL